MQRRIAVVPCLMRFNPKAKIGGGRVTDVRGGGGGGGMGNIPIGGITGGGIGTTIVVIIIFVIVQLAGGGGGLSGGGGPVETTDRYEQCQTGEDANNNADCARKAVALSLDNYWQETLPKQTNTRYEPTQIVTFTGGTSTGCGSASADVGSVLLPDRPDHLPRHHVLRGGARGPARRPGR